MDASLAGSGKYHVFDRFIVKALIMPTMVSMVAISVALHASQVTTPRPTIFGTIAHSTSSSDHSSDSSAKPQTVQNQDPVVHSVRTVSQSRASTVVPAKSAAVHQTSAPSSAVSQTSPPATQPTQPITTVPGTTLPTVNPVTTPNQGVSVGSHAAIPDLVSTVIFGGNPLTITIQPVI